MRTLDPDVYLALQQRKLMYRDFVWFIVRNRDTLAEVTDGYWSGSGTVIAPVINPVTGATQDRQFASGGGLIKISDISLVSTLQVHNVTITLSQVADRTNDLVRQYECKQGQVQIFRALYNPDTRLIVSPAEARFIGTIDQVTINTPSEDGEGKVDLSCTSNTQELTRSNPDTRSYESQFLRGGVIDDDFYRDTTTVGKWQIFWGKLDRSNKVAVTKTRTYNTGL